MQSVWAGTAVTDDSLVQCIHEIRRALKDDGHAILKTKSRRGYMLVLPEANAAATPATDPASKRALRRPLAVIVGSLLIVLAVAAAAWWMPQAPPPSGKPVVAVLPFDVLEEDAAARRLGNGLTEDIITDLARFPGIPGNRERFDPDIRRQIDQFGRDRQSAWGEFRGRRLDPAPGRPAAHHCAAPRRGNRQASVVGSVGPAPRGSVRCPDRDLRAGLQPARRRATA